MSSKEVSSAAKDVFLISCFLNGGKMATLSKVGLSFGILGVNGIFSSSTSISLVESGNFKTSSPLSEACSAPMTTLRQQLSLFCNSVQTLWCILYTSTTIIF